jgi:uncharacterized protein YjdB
MKPLFCARILGVLCALAGVAVWSSCSGMSASSESNTSKLTTIVVTPTNKSIAKGTSLQVTATGVYSNGTQQALIGVTWQTSAASVASISVTGSVTGVGQGVAQISATYEGITGSTSVTVGAAALVSIALTPNPSSLPIGETESLTATGSYSDGTTQNLTQSVTWSAASAVASVSSTGALLAKAAGSTTITATSGSISGSANVTVTSAVLVALNVAPSNQSIALGQTLQFTATGVYSDGSQQQLTSSAIWQTNPTSVATINAQGNLTAVNRGVAQISATYQSVSGNASVTVGAPVLVSIAVSPNPTSLPVGESENLTATGSYSDGSTQNLTQSVAWSSGSAAASVSSAGIVLAKAQGNAVISATSNSLTGTASVNVTAAVATSLSVNPSTLTILLGDTGQFQAVENFSDGTTQNVTSSASWSSSQPSIATINSTGAVAALLVGTTTVEAQSGGLSGSATLVVSPLMTVSYFDLADSQNSGIDGTVRLTNPGLTGGDLCAMIYVFDSNQEMNECCGCLISDSGLLTLSLTNDLTANTLTGKKPVAGSVETVSSTPSGGQCNAGAVTPQGMILGWETNVQAASTSYQITEAPWAYAPLATTEMQVLQTECSMIQTLGSGQGICTCGTGD